MPGSLTLQSSLTFNSNGGYDYLLRASGRRILADRVNANGVGVNFQANYQGGDGNDLTLTVVP